jgi:Kip1 ubiquitination-promoting complex protein 1
MVTMTPDEEVLMACAALQHVGPLLAAPKTRRYYVAGCLMPSMMRAAAAATAAAQAKGVHAFANKTGGDSDWRDGDKMPDGSAAAWDARMGQSRNQSWSQDPSPRVPHVCPPGRVDCYERSVQLLCVALDPEELAEVVPELMACLAEHVRSSPLVVLDPASASKLHPQIPTHGTDLGLGSTTLPVALPQLMAHAPLACAVALARHPESRTAWLARRGWGASMEGLLTCRVPNADDLAVMLPARSVWWPGCGASEATFAEFDPKVSADSERQFPGCPGSESECKARGKALGEAMVRTCTLHAVLLQTLAMSPATLPTAGDCDDVAAGSVPAAIINVPGVAEEDLPADPAAAAFVSAQRAAAAAAGATGASTTATAAGVLPRRFQGSASFISAPSLSVPGHGDCVLIVLLRWLTYKNRATCTTRAAQPQPPGNSDHTVLASTYFALLMLLHPHLEVPAGTELASPPPGMFWDSLAYDLDLPLFGGGCSHVRKTFPPERDPSAPGAAPLTIRPEVLRDPNVSPAGVAASLAVLANPDSAMAAVGIAPGTFPATLAEAARCLPMTRLWDCLQLLYHLGVSTHFKAAAFQLQTQIQAAQQLEDASRRLVKAEEASRMHAMATAAVTAGTRGGAGAVAGAGTGAANSLGAEAVAIEGELRAAAGDSGAEAGVGERAAGQALTAAADELLAAANQSITATANLHASTNQTIAAANELLAKLREARGSLRDNVVEAARHCWWHRAVLHRPEQQVGMFSAAAYGAALMLAAMARGKKRRSSRVPSATAAAATDGGGGNEGGEDERVESEGSFGEGQSEGEGEEGSASGNSESDEDSDGAGAEVGGGGGGNGGATDVSGGGDSDATFTARREESRRRRALKKKGVLLPHIPAYHIEALIDSFHALRRGDPPFTPTAPALAAGAPGLHTIVSLMVRHFADVRIVNPDIRDAMLQSISVLLQYKEYVGVFEANPEARRSMVPALLKSFDSRFWIPVSNILLRLCRGVGFGQGGGGRAWASSGLAAAAAAATGEAAAAAASGGGPGGGGGEEEGEAAAAGNPSGWMEDRRDAAAAAASPDTTLARAIAAPHPDSASPLFQHLIVDTCRSHPKVPNPSPKPLRPAKQ